MTVMGKQWFNSSCQKHLNLYCPFNKSCLYLDGEPPEKVFAERNYLRTRVDELEGAVNFGTGQVMELRKRNAELETEKENIQKELVRALQAPFKKYEVKEISENPKKKGPPFGHPGHFRKRPDGIDEYVDVRLDKCPHCENESLSPCSHTAEHVQEDIESGRLKATCFIHSYYWCSVCRKVVHGWGANEIPNAFIGPDARAKASFLRYEIKVSYDDVQRVLHHMCGLTVVPGTIVGFDNKAFRKGEPLYEALKETLPKTRYIHVDETGWKREWLWIFTNDQIAFFHIDEHRSSAVVKAHLGEFYNGVLITDFYSAYRDSIEAFAKQKCCTHLLRDVRELLEKGVPENSDAAVFLQDLKKLIKDAIFIHSMYSSLSPEQFCSEKKGILKRFRELYENPISHKEAETIRKRLVTHKNELFTFLKYPGLVEPTNNRAEQGLRNSVIFRRLTFGTRTEQGKKNVSLIITVIRTAKLRCLNPIKILKSIVTKGTTPELLELFGIPTVMPQAP
jgi:hypothetical protein